MIRLIPARRGWTCEGCSLTAPGAEVNVRTSVEALEHLTLHGRAGEDPPLDVLEQLYRATWLDENRGWIEAAAARWAPRSPRALRLRAWLRGPIFWDARDTLQIEGALQHVVIRREAGEMPFEVFANCSREEGAATNVQIPIVDVQIGGLPVSAASAAWPWALSAEGTRNRGKRPRVDAIGLDKLPLSGGAFKALRIPTGVLHVPFLDFFVRGDEEQLRDLLADVSGLGRDAARGLGIVDGWEITEDALDRAFVFRGRPMRPLPLVFDDSPYDVRNLAAGSYERRHSTVRAPYWRNWTRVDAVMPLVSFADATSWWAEELRTEGDPLAPPAPSPGAAGRFFITPHAVDGYIERIRPGLSREVALAELIQLTSAGRSIGPYNGSILRGVAGPGVRLELWRAPRVGRQSDRLAQSRMRFVVSYSERFENSLPQVISVLPVGAQ